MKLNKSFIVSFSGLMIAPILGVLISIFQLNKKNAKYCILILSIFVFFITIKISPYQDLYRRYLVTYLQYTSNTTLSDALYGHIDVLFYFNAWAFFNLGIPFYFIPAIYSALSVYFVMISASSIWLKDEGISKQRFLILFFAVFSFIDVVMIASTLRFGFAVALMLRGVVLYSTQKKGKGAVYIILSCLCHASMYLVVVAFIASCFYKMSKKQCIIFSIIFFVMSSTLVPVILSHVNLGVVNDYFINGYVDSDFANVTDDSHTLLLQLYKYGLFVVLTVIYFKNDGVNTKYDNFVRHLIAISFVMAISITALNRYLIGISIQFVMFGAFVINGSYWLRSIIKPMIVVILLFNITFINIYLERRQIQMARLWTGLYLPPAVLLYYNMDQFNNYLSELDSDGNWVKNKLGGK